VHAEIGRDNIKFTPTSPRYYSNSRALFWRSPNYWFFPHSSPFWPLNLAVQSSHILCAHGECHRPTVYHSHYLHVKICITLCNNYYYGRVLCVRWDRPWDYSHVKYKKKNMIWVYVSLKYCQQVQVSLKQFSVTC